MNLELPELTDDERKKFSEWLRVKAARTLRAAAAEKPHPVYGRKHHGEILKAAQYVAKVCEAFRQELDPA